MRHDLGLSCLHRCARIDLPEVRVSGQCGHRLYPDGHEPHPDEFRASAASSADTRNSIVVIAIVVLIAAATVFNAAVLGPGDAREKAACMSNLRYIALATLMYAADYGETLPLCVPSDREGTAHAVGGLFQNRTWDDFQSQVTTKYGAQYADGRWMWQLADALRPYVRDDSRFNCPTLVWRDPSFRMKSYIVGTDPAGKPDPRDPLRGLLPGENQRKVRRSGSYVYMCAHYDRARASSQDFGSGVGVQPFQILLLAQMLGYISDYDQPQRYFACGNHLAAFADPAHKPLAMCDSFGVHEGYNPEYIADHVVPPELGGAPPTIRSATPVAFVDGHVSYIQMKFYDMVAMFVSPNEKR
jgi:prepilin-type processing-associated H-X9-DG protein